MKLSKHKDRVETFLAILRDAMDLGEAQDPLDFVLTRDDFKLLGLKKNCEVDLLVVDKAINRIVSAM